jgi:hypothetical protein
LSVPLAMLSGAPPGAAPVFLGLPLAVLTVALMLGWIHAGRLPQWLPGVCIVALLVDLLAAGGIAMPGIAGTFWLLLALGLDGRWPRSFRTFPAWVALAGVMALAVACYCTAYEPVLHCQAEMNRVRGLEAAAGRTCLFPLHAGQRQGTGVDPQFGCHVADRGRLGLSGVRK